MVEQVLALSLPFGLSAVIQVLSPGVRLFVARWTPIVFPEFPMQSPAVQQRCLDLAVFTYVHLSFIFGILLSCISSVAFTITSSYPLFAALGAGILISVIPIWVFRWLGVPISELEGKKGFGMKMASWATIVILWGVTLYARLSST